jgi:heme/copper-type cytochrome/quinol oxidase subunit 1
MIKKDLRTDLIWLFALGTMTLLTIGLLIGFDNWTSRPFEIQLHDTYIILSIGQVFLLLFLNVTFWTYLIRQGKNGFKRQSSNIVLMLVTGLLIFITSLTIKFIGSMDQGWTIYPPMSSSPTKIPEKYSITSGINSIVQVYELFQIGVLGFIGIRIGGGIEKHSP